MRDKTATWLIFLPLVLAVGHHVDHLIRGTHLGWPFIPEFTPFTGSLAVYPVIALGYYLYRQKRVGAGFWALLAAAGLAFVALTHFGPFAIDPAGDILSTYDSAIAGWIALAWLFLFFFVLAVALTYFAYLSVKRQKSIQPEP